MRHLTQMKHRSCSLPQVHIPGISCQKLKQDYDGPEPKARVTRSDEMKK